MAAPHHHALLALLCGLLFVGPGSRSARAEVFSAGPVEGILDVTLAYGLATRSQERDLDFIGIANGGNAPSVHPDLI